MRALALFALTVAFAACNAPEPAPANDASAAAARNAARAASVCWDAGSCAVATQVIAHDIRPPVYAPEGGTPDRAAPVAEPDDGGLACTACIVLPPCPSCAIVRDDHIVVSLPSAPVGQAAALVTRAANTEVRFLPPPDTAAFIVDVRTGAPDGTLLSLFPADR